MRMSVSTGIGFLAALAIGSASMAGFTSAARAASDQQHITTVTSDAIPNDQGTFAAQMDPQGDLTGVMYREGKKSPVRFISLAELQRGKVLLHNAEHHLDVATVRIESDFTAKDGGHVRLIYLSNGITKSYRYFVFEVVRAGTRWFAYASTGRDSRGRASQPFTAMNLKARRFLGQIVGVERVETR